MLYLDTFNAKNKRMKLKLSPIYIILIIASFANAKLYAQMNDETAAYFDDNNISSGNNLIKFDLVSLIHGDLAFSYERFLIDQISIEVGAGILLPYYTPQLLYIIDSEMEEEDPFEITDPHSGYSFLLRGKYYYDIYREGGYFAMQYRHRNYKLTDSRVIHNDLTFNYGYQIIFRNNFLLDLSAGIGARFKKAIEIETFKQVEFLYDISIKVGYILK